MKLFSTPHVIPFSDRATHGRGFMVAGKKFVHHSNLGSHESAAVSILPSQKLFALGFVVSIALLLWLSWFYTILIGIGLVTLLYFVDLLFGLFLAYKSFSQNPEVSISREELAALKTSDLPSYTIFCPLYKEWRVLPQFVEAMNNLEYPKTKLQIMLQLEADDTETIARAKAMQLPRHFKIVVVPHSLPKTKPKAMNYGLKFATGEIITIYDAEDVPEPLQLKKVVAAFLKLPPETVCVQGKLNFYNPHQNLLTRMFTAEYSLWFDLILPGLQSIGAPIPLGGTSNHFKKLMLQELAGWDAFNVTEDCDLGLRIAKRGYKTAIVDSTTLEEANSGYHNWYRQRSRWIKGYMQTYLVHMRNPRKSAQEFGWKNLLLMQLTVGGKVLSMFVNPFLWVVTIIYFVFRTQAAPIIEPFFPPVVLLIGVVSLVFGNFFYVYAYLIGLAKRREFSVMKYVFLVPVYWLFMSVAAWKALYELIVKPHYWQKTVHGLHLAQQGGAPEEVMSNLEFPISNEEEAESEMPVAQPVGAGVFATAENVVQPLSVGLKKLSYAKKVANAPRVSAYHQEPKPDSFITRVLRQLGLEHLTNGVWLVGAMMLANVLNFLFSAILGRTLAPENFGTLSLFTTIILLTGIVTGALGGSINYRVARYVGSNNRRLMRPFIRMVASRAVIVGGVVLVGWLIVAPTLAHFFHIQQTFLVLAFAPIFPIMLSQGIWAGFLRGDFAFKLVALGTLADPVVKLLVGALLIALHRQDLAPVAIFASVTAGWLTLLLAGRYTLFSESQKAIGTKTPTKETSVSFPQKYFYSAVLAGSASTLFLTADVLLVKHYFTPSIAGSYALLSLCGNMIFYLCSLPSVFITTVVSRERGEGGDGRKSFLPLFRLVIAAAVAGFIGVGLLGRYTIPLLFGSHALPIVPYLPVYAAALSLMAISSSYIAYRLAKDDYGYAWFGVLGAVIMATGIMWKHATMGQVAYVVLVASATTAFLLFAWHAVTRHGRFVFRNLIDLLDVFAPLPPLSTVHSTLSSASKRILIFNWRDTKHVHAGGAEVYLHEVAKRWAAEGNTVTLFCGNDGSAPRFETIDGVHVIRRGGFYMVWFWAFVYYMLRLRGKFDVILDSDSALPFFTPLFVREPVVCLVHHVHQQIFKEHLVWPAAVFACAVERYFVPFVYRHTQLITVSESTKKDMIALGLTGSGIEVINPGTNLDQFAPGEKDAHPLVVYVGRLKAYKSVDVLIRAFDLLRLTHPQARLIIAGAGEEEGNLKDLTKTLHLTKAVSFLGKVEEDLKVWLMQQAWVFANPSSMEGWGITSIEANACGTPVVASNVPGLRDSVQNPHTGYLVQYGNPAAFADKIGYLLSDTKQRHFMESESLLWAQNFDWDIIADKSLNVITKV